MLLVCLPDSILNLEANKVQGMSEFTTSTRTRTILNCGMSLRSDPTGLIAAVGEEGAPAEAPALS